MPHCGHNIETHPFQSQYLILTPVACCFVLFTILLFGGCCCCYCFFFFFFCFFILQVCCCCGGGIFVHFWGEAVGLGKGGYLHLVCFGVVNVLF